MIQNIPYVLHIIYEDFYVNTFSTNFLIQMVQLRLFVFMCSVKKLKKGKQSKTLKSHVFIDYMSILKGNGRLEGNKGMLWREEWSTSATPSSSFPVIFLGVLFVQILWTEVLDWELHCIHLPNIFVEVCCCFGLFFILCHCGFS